MNRPKGSLMPDLPQEGDLGAYVTTCLAENGIGIDNLYYRTFQRERVDDALRTGTDRDRNSNIAYPGHEPGLMERAGLFRFDADKVTWVSPLAWLSQVKQSGPIGLSVYDGSQLEFLDSGSGFCKFRNPLYPEGALVAVFKRD